jgi:hypothetical protein
VFTANRGGVCARRIGHTALHCTALHCTALHCTGSIREDWGKRFNHRLLRRRMEWLHRARESFHPQLHQGGKDGGPSAVPNVQKLGGGHCALHCTALHCTLCSPCTAGPSGRPTGFPKLSDSTSSPGNCSEKPDKSPPAAAGGARTHSPPSCRDAST